MIRTWTVGERESPREEEDGSDTCNTHRIITITRDRVEGFVGASFHRHECGTEDCSDDQGPAASNAINWTDTFSHGLHHCPLSLAYQSDEDKGDNETPCPRKPVDDQLSMALWRSISGRARMTGSRNSHRIPRLDRWSAQSSCYAPNQQASRMA